MGFFPRKNGCGLYRGFPTVKKACRLSLELCGSMLYGFQTLLLQKMKSNLDELPRLKFAKH